MTRWGERPAPDPDGPDDPARLLGATGLSGAADLSGVVDLGSNLDDVAAPSLAESDDEDDPAGGPDVVGIVAVGVGLVGIVVLGLLLALLAGVLGGLAGQRAREAGRPLDLAYLAIGLGALDGVVWVVLHLLFDIPVQIG